MQVDFENLSTELDSRLDDTLYPDESRYSDLHKEMYNPLEILFWFSLFQVIAESLND